MGLIRFLLAITVIIAHSNPLFGFSFLGGQLAVEVFFIISGFYMALILSEKYHQKENRKFFLGNRLLKIFPIYWAVLILSFIYEIVNLKFNFPAQNVSSFFQSNIHTSLSTFILFITTNLVILGQDILLFFGLNPQTGSLFFTNNFRLFEPATYSFMFIPQAWTLSLELCFYFLAPKLTKIKTQYLLIIMFISLIIRLVLYRFGLNHDPWTYRFFPTELIFFLSGIISYRIYHYLKQFLIKPQISLIIFGFYLSYLCFYQFLPHQTIKMIVLFILSIFLLPLIFKFTKDFKADSYIGELSYPIYISHFLVINTLTHFTLLNHDYLSLIASVLSIILSILLTIFILKPINTYRHRRLKIQNTI